MREKYKGLDNRNLRLLNQSDAELTFQRYRKIIWIIQKSETLEAAAKKLKLTTRQVSNISTKIRRGGVPLKTFNKAWEALPKEKIPLLRRVAEETAKPPVDYEKFVRLWNTTGPVATAKVMCMTRDQARYISSWLYTRCGIKLNRYHNRIKKELLQRIANETATSFAPIPPHRISLGSTK